MRRSLLFPFLLAATGCADLFGDADAKSPGEPLGTFHVTATLGANTCGDKALGAPATWEFDVQLARADGVIYWNNGQRQVSGTLASSGTAFDVKGEVDEDMRTDDHPGPPCSIARRDEVTGSLTLSGASVTAASGQLTFAFQAKPGSLCDDLVASTAPPNASPLFQALPCQIAYTFSAPRTAAP